MFDGYPLVAAVGAADQSDLVSPHTAEICQIIQQPLVGFAIDRGSGEAYSQPIAQWSGDFITAGAWLDTDIQDQGIALPVIPGCGHLPMIACS